MTTTGRLLLRGIAASHGVAVGPVFVLDNRTAPVPRRRLSMADVDPEVQRLREAIDASRHEIEAVRESLSQEHGDYELILDAHLLMHRDELLVDAAIGRIREGRNAEWAIRRTIDALKAPLQAAGSHYFRERADDVEHVGQHILRHLVGETRALPLLDTPAVLVAGDLSPADAARLFRSHVMGVVTTRGSATGHTALLARGLEIPAVVGVPGVLGQVEPGEPIVVDGLRGEVVIGAPEEELARATQRGARHREFTRGLLERSGEPSETKDGVTVTLSANVELLAEAALVEGTGAAGIGLYRTEFLYLGRKDEPSEEEQFEVYSEVARLSPGPVVFRTFDLGGDKLPSGTRATAQNPALGRRAIRLSLSRPELFRAQVRAILRTASESDVRLMFPLVATVEELREARALVDLCKAELDEEDLDFGDVPVGIMVEVPSAALVSPALARECDFFSVGTNDLVQYTLAADRADAEVAHLADPLHPAVLVLLDRTARAAEAAGIGLSMCGDMAADPVAMPIVLGLGFRHLSMPLGFVPFAREVVRRVRMSELEELAVKALACDRAPDVRRLVIDALREPLGELWEEEAVDL